MADITTLCENAKPLNEQTNVIGLIPRTNKSTSSVVKTMVQRLCLLNPPYAIKDEDIHIISFHFCGKIPVAREK